MSSASFRKVLCHKILFKKEEAIESSHAPTSPFDRNIVMLSRDDTICFLQSSRHNSTTSQLNTINMIQAPRTSPNDNSNASSLSNRETISERRQKRFNCLDMFQSKKNNISTPLDDINYGGIELQAPIN